jgi:hypothetical protein
MRSSHRDEGSADMKKSRRFAPYGERDAGRLFKNIVPAPPKELETPPVVSPLSTAGSSISPKRKRKEDIEPLEYSLQPGIHKTFRIG